MVGVTASGEQPLKLELGLGAARLRHLLEKLNSRPKQQQRFLEHLRQQLELSNPAQGAIQAIRTYSETWKIQNGLKGIDKPTRKLVGAIYLPPLELVRRLEDEAAGTASPLKADLLDVADVVLDLEAESCREACSEVIDQYAFKSKALRLDCKGSKQTGSLVVAELPAGTWHLLVRIKGAEASHPATWTLGNGKPKTLSANGLPTGGWVWVSSRAGYPVSTVTTGEARHLQIFCDEHPVEVDQIWLSKNQGELPYDNAPRVQTQTQ
jgi:hypothetical protein